MTEKKNKPNVSFYIPVYNDQKTIEIVVDKALKLLKKVANLYEILIIDDYSSDNSRIIIKKLMQKNKNIRAIFNPKNLGYGAVMKIAIRDSKFDIVCTVDGDDEYDISDIEKMLKISQYYGLIICFRYKRMYSSTRIFISHIYNILLRFHFSIKYRDINTGIRLFKKSAIKDIKLTTNSPFTPAELVIKSYFSGLPVGELGIQTFPNSFRRSNIITIKNLWVTYLDMLKIKKEIFSSTYQLPPNRIRN